jgi:hypothetical protein
VTRLNSHPKADPFILVQIKAPSKPDQENILPLDVYIIAATKHAAPLDGPWILCALVK